MDTFYSNGKLLLTGEYVVLDGANSLAIPCKYGQSLEIHPIKEPKLIWESYTNTNECWLQVELDLPRLRLISETFDSETNTGHDSLALKLQELILEAKKMNPDFLNAKDGYYVKASMDFPINWGLGSSSTLVNNIAQWAKIDAFALQFAVFDGSGYDIACAQNNLPILYQLKDKKSIVQPVGFDPDFKDQLYFVHLNKKQNSREGIAQYRNFKGPISTFVEDISQLTNEMILAKTLDDFERVLATHEHIIGSIINQRPIQERLFSGYFGKTKSLGAWGGDFILATGNENSPNYFKEKGFETVIKYTEMVKPTSTLPKLRG